MPLDFGDSRSNPNSLESDVSSFLLTIQVAVNGTHNSHFPRTNCMFSLHIKEEKLFSQ